MTWFVNYTSDMSISPADRGLAYGDGVFETIHAKPKHFCNLSNHLARLYLGLERLGMAFDNNDKNRLEGFLQQRILPLIKQDQVVKILVSRGEGGRGYLPPEQASHTVAIGVLDFPDYQSIQNQGVAISVSPVPLSENAFFAGIKHLNRLEQVLAKQHLQSDFFEALMLNTTGKVIEAIQSNVFWFKEGQLFTPAIEQSGVKGTFRQGILDLVTSNGLHVINEGCYELKDLLKADEIFLTSSLMKIVPVIRVQQSHFAIGVNTLNLQRLMQVKEMHGIR
ncbi:aminodeoxychorismate lyase [Marinomonas sp. THO17]|uniref:aminodeoxychorismate lyase n=1 Tax=Marinomonas sp. THO17 TaxID=3149048 RepID=UPI00336C2C5B